MSASQMTGFVFFAASSIFVTCTSGPRTATLPEQIEEKTPPRTIICLKTRISMREYNKVDYFSVGAPLLGCGGWVLFQMHRVGFTSKEPIAGP